MLDKREIDQAIAELENNKTTFAACSKLATLYTVREHAFGDKEREEQGYSFAALPETKSEEDVIRTRGNSEFLQAVNGKRAESVWKIIDNLMGTLHVVNPRVHDDVIRRLNDL